MSRRVRWVTLCVVVVGAALFLAAPAAESAHQVEVEIKEGAVVKGRWINSTQTFPVNPAAQGCVLKVGPQYTITGKCNTCGGPVTLKSSWVAAPHNHANPINKTFAQADRSTQVKDIWTEAECTDTGQKSNGMYTITHVFVAASAALWNGGLVLTVHNGEAHPQAGAANVAMLEKWDAQSRPDYTPQQRNYVRVLTLMVWTTIGQTWAYGGVSPVGTTNFGTVTHTVDGDSVSAGSDPNKVVWGRP